MDEEDKPFPSSRHRSPTFSKDEVKELVNLIDKHKHIVMNKSISATACHAKEATWAKIADRFNSRGFEYVRTADSLKMKWENLKKDARKISKNVIDTKNNEFSALNAQIVSILCDAENNSAIDAPALEDETDNIENSEQKESTNNSVIYWDEGEKQPQEDTGDDNERSSRISRSLNFSPKECSLLLQCVRQEKQNVFCKEVTTKAIKMKNTAWSRITDSYNKLSPQKRTTKVLRTKFSNMKRMARQVGFKDYFKGLGSKHEKLIDDEHNAKDIKKEPEFSYKLDADVDWNDNNDDDDYSNHKTDDDHINFAPDPLSSVLNGDSGIGSTHTESLNQSENQEVVKLKMELLNYEMETAKLKRKRIEDALEADAAARDSRALETALRLRAARLAALAAHGNFPPAHPALHYTAEEARAQHYLSQYHHA